MSEKLSKILDSLKDKNLKKDAESVRTLLEVSKAIAEDVFGDNTTFNDAVSVYSILKTEKITRIAEERFAKLGNQVLAPGAELLPILGGPFGGNGGVS